MSAAPGAAYVDSSALVKLVIPEPQSAALRAELARWGRHVSSALVRAEVVRACVRADPTAGPIADQVVAALDLLAVDDGVLNAAARIEPVELRTLDAIHVASALLVRHAIGIAITYDARMIEAMRAAGLPALAPA